VWDYACRSVGKSPACLTYRRRGNVGQRALNCELCSKINTTPYELRDRHIRYEGDSEGRKEGRLRRTGGSRSQFKTTLDM